MSDESRPDLAELTRSAGDALSVRRVFGEPYEVEGTLVVPVGKVIGSYGLAAATGDARLGLRGSRGGARPPDGHPADDAGPDGGAPGEPADAEAGHEDAGVEAHARPDDHDHPGPHGPHAGGPAHWHAPGGHRPGGRPWPFAGVRPSGRGAGQADSGGYAVRVKPLGVYVIRPDGHASWQPALDLNRVILGGQAVGAVVGVAAALAWAVTRLRR